ncbi:hypothetical protein Csa_006387 [Cucumis sativus]|uniref:S-protein homolog n=1 Tax=Cucumis sativus TaxID=3659 RepID=A0A0A0LI28_CUCSA|nr:hypothetical protein Csa_006387 [Cucumis sativus]
MLQLRSIITLHVCGYKSETNQAQPFTNKVYSLSFSLLISKKMSSFSTFGLSLFISLLFATIFTIEGKPFQSPPVTVNITNALKDVNNQLTIHCKSGDDDLGVHQLSHLASYAFNFRPNFWGSTLFYCAFDWTGSSHYFNIYQDLRDRAKCNDTLCLWIVGEQGLCMFDYKTNAYDICYTWS